MYTYISHKRNLEQRVFNDCCVMALSQQPKGVTIMCECALFVSVCVVLVRWSSLCLLSVPPFLFGVSLFLLQRLCLVQIFSSSRRFSCRVRPLFSRFLFSSFSCLRLSDLSFLSCFAVFPYRLTAPTTLLTTTYPHPPWLETCTDFVVHGMAFE